MAVDDGSRADMPSPVLYYVRHGETDWNAARRLQGQRDIALNARGHSQAVACGEILHDLLARDGRAPADYDYISSPLMRARQTMQLIRATLDLAREEYRVDPRLQELSFGEWEGLTFSEVRARDPEVIRERERDKWCFVPPGGESYEQLMLRVRDWKATLAGDAGARSWCCSASLRPRRRSTPTSSRASSIVSSKAT